MLHWSGPQVSPTQTAADSAQFFTFGVTVPSPASQTSYGANGSGAEGFFVVQQYADPSDKSIWKCPNDPRPATDVANGLVRTVAGTAPPPPTPTPLPPPLVHAGDGKIVFQSARDGNNEIYLSNADGTGLTRLTNNPADDQRPAFSPDGTKIVYSTDRSGNREITITNSNSSSGALNITNNPALDDWPRWSPIPGKATTTTLSAIPIRHPLGSGGHALPFATVTPFNATGTVQFKDGNTDIGAPVPVRFGRAIGRLVFLPPGPHSLTTTFIPADLAAFQLSTSNTVAFTF